MGDSSYDNQKDRLNEVLEYEEPIERTDYNDINEEILKHHLYSPTEFNKLTDISQLNNLKKIFNKLIDKRIEYLNDEAIIARNKEIEAREDAIQDKKNDDYNNQQKREAEQRKRANEQSKKQETNVKQQIIDEYGSTIVKETELKKQGFQKIVPLRCEKCKVLKILPYDFINKKGKVNDNKDICSTCVENRSKQMIEYVESRKELCSCGIKYYFPTEKDRQEHLQSDRHRKALQNNKTMNGVKYTVEQLREIIRFNKTSDGSLYVQKYSLLSKTQLMEAINKIPNVKIPSF